GKPGSVRNLVSPVDPACKRHMRCLVQLGSLDFADGSTWQQAGDDLQALLLLSAMTWFEAAREAEAASIAW
ncbi:MAG: hypothetical protein WB688_16390, partial [Trebonia sp.]